MNEHYELEDMRQQLANLKHKLDTQEIINDRLFRKTLSAKVSAIHRHRNKVIILGVIAILFNIPLLLKMGFSIYLAVYTLLMLCFSVATTIHYHSEMENSNLSSDDLLTTAKKLKTLKIKYNRFYWISIPMVTVYLGWILYEMSILFDAETAKYMIAGAIFGGIIGAIAGVSMNRRLIRMCDDLISDIENN